MPLSVITLQDVFKQKVTDIVEKTTLEVCDPTTLLIDSIRKDLDMKILQALLSLS